MMEVSNEKSKQIVVSIPAFGKTMELLKVSQLGDGKEKLIIQMLLDIPNNPVNDIRQKEIISITTFKNPTILPLVFAIRNDFPLGLSHTNSTTTERPVSLCIYEESFDELKHRWSASLFLQAIKNWLELTSIDALHQEDQYLEPFVIGNGFLIFDITHRYVEKLNGNIYRTTGHYNRNSFHFCSLNLEPIENGVVHQSPSNLFELKELLKIEDVDVIKLIREEVYKISNEGIKHKLQGDFWNGILILILVIPVKRNSSETETSFIALKINRSLGDLLRNFGHTIVAFDKIFKTEDDLSEEALRKIEVETLNLMSHLDIERAKTYSCIKKEVPSVKISLVGLGALGSQFFMNFARKGFGTWKLLDNDILFPHNFVRHASIDINNHTSENKAVAISKQANDLLNQEDFSQPFPVSVYDIDRANLDNSDIIIDMSTSVGVERFLSHEFKKIRKISSFLNPMGTDLVMLMEDSNINYPLDILEFQYYKELINNTELHNHLAFEQEGRIRYARGCRDITSKIPQENLAVFSGIATKAVQGKLSSTTPSIDIWRLNDSFGVSKNSFKVDSWSINSYKGWEVLFNDSTLKTISNFRKSKLPNETGGILIGAIDTYYKKIYIVHTILAPEDSIEKPTLFIRGIKGVSEKLQQIEEITNGNLMYLGEWHSHPKNCSLEMSADDKLQFAELLFEARLLGQPALMAIFGDEQNYNLYLDNLEI